MMKSFAICFLLANMAAMTVIAELSCEDICHVDKLEMYRNVCGSDGKTYATECDLKIAVCKSRKAVTIVHHGECKYKGSECLSKIPCHMDKAQLCSSDRKQYYNECAMRKHACKEKKAKIGVKLGNQCSSCPTCNGESGEKVCGSDHHTYGSLCELRAKACQKKQAIIVLKKGPCDAASKEGSEAYEIDEALSPDAEEDYENVDDDDDDVNRSDNQDD